MSLKKKKKPTKVVLPSIQITLDSKIICLVPTVIKESDRGAVIVCGTLLETVIARNFLPSEPRYNFDQKIALLRKLFVQPRLGELLLTIRSLRNRAAHSTEEFLLQECGQEFSNNLVNQARKLQVYKQVEATKVSTKQGSTDIEISLKDLIANMESQKSAAQRIQFFLVTVVVIAYLDAVTKQPLASLKNHIPDFK